MRILIVEDELKIASFLKESLEAEYFAVDVAVDGAEGASLTHINEYDLVILDNMLPKKDGLTVLREMRDSGNMVPVLILSVRGDAAQKVDFLNAGADDYLTKPFAFSELLARVHALLRRPKEIGEEVLTIDGLELDTVRGTVTRDGEEIYLTRKEFMLLRYLMLHEGTVLSRGMILEHVWDQSTDIFSNTIESHILSLRKKIKDTGDCRLIQTIPGRGYKICI